jgi:hypothetical protein
MDAIIKINWKGSAHCVDPGSEFQGGVCGTCFTLSSGITISADHICRDLFRPIEGFDACRVFAANSATEITLLRQGCVRSHPEFDACVIDGYSSPITYSVSATPAADVSTCQLLGYTANTVPFSISRGSDNLPTIGGLDLHSVAQRIQAEARLVNFNISSEGLTVVGKQGFMFKAAGRIGLSGGPAIELTNGQVVGLCVMGLPPDISQKDHIGAIDLRQFNFL